MCPNHTQAEWRHIRDESPADWQAADFDDSGWETIEPAALEARRSTGKLCFNWYRTAITVPGRVGAFETRGSTIVFEIVVDDYAEIWVDGQLPRVLGTTGGALAPIAKALLIALTSTPPRI
jgi:hypothetical protein